MSSGSDTPPLPAEQLSEKLQSRTATVAVVGLGYVGLPLVRVMHDAGFSVLGYDNDVKVTFRMGTLEDGKRVPTKTYNLIVSSGTSGSKLLSGSRVPFPTSTDGDGIVYQNVGFTTEVLTWILDKKRIKLLANIENSIVIEDEDGGPPSVETRQVSVNVGRFSSHLHP